MIIYEVNLEVVEDAVEEVSTWLPGHIEEVIALPGFLSAEWYQVLGDDGGGSYSIRYALRSETDLQHYLAAHAARMRADGLERFGGRFSARRRVLRPLRSFAAGSESDRRPATP